LKVYILRKTNRIEEALKYCELKEEAVKHSHITFKPQTLVIEKAKLMKSLKKYDQSIYFLQKYLDSMCDMRLEANNMIGKYFSIQGEYEEAISYFNECIYKNKKYLKAYFNKGKVYIALK